MESSIREWYSVHYETWHFSKRDGNYTSGPFREKDLEFETKEEAMKYVDKFIADYPDAQDFRISYDEKDPDMGILEQKMIKALKHDEGKLQFTIEVFYMKTTW